MRVSIYTLRLGALAAALVLVLACGGSGGSEVPMNAEEAWQVARAQVRKERSCYDNNPRFCPDDPVVLDRLIQGVLDQKHQGKMPEKPFDVRVVAQLATTAYKRWLVTDEGRAATEALVRAAWDSPTVSTSKDGVMVTMSVLPCELTPRVRTNDALVCLRPDASLLDRGEPATAVVAPLLDRYTRENPSASSVTIEVPMPDDSSRAYWHYRYVRAAGHVLVGKKYDHPSFFKKAPVNNGDFGPYLTGAASLNSRDLK